ncbi:MAG: lipid-A-disaccharide synthase, partial [Mucinivorans sp.]
MKYYIIVGEASGDMHGANLIKSIKKRDPKAEFRFFGGDKMVEVTSPSALVVHYKESSIMGFIEVLMNLRKILRFLKLCKRDIAAWKPDLVILIDYPGFNFKIAKWAHHHNFKTCYYIAPKVWAWKEGRAKMLKKYVDRLLVIFPFEVEWFAARGIEARYVGNPLLDEIAARRAVVSQPEKPIV